jgi:hypothetical protein
VHHAINDEYMDRNFSQIFIFWDRLFGTFQEELDDVPPIYGIRRQAKTWNPFLINFQHLALIIKDSWRTKKWSDKFWVWFKPTGWRPADVSEKYPVEYISDVYKQNKYMPEVSNFLIAWSWVQLTSTFALILFLFNQLVEIGQPGMYVYGVFIFVSIFSYTSLMDKNKHAWWLELMRCFLGLAILNINNGWFTLDNFVSFGSYIIGGYLIVSALVHIVFDYYEIKKSDLIEA